MFCGNARRHGTCRLRGNDRPAAAGAQVDRARSLPSSVGTPTAPTAPSAEAIGKQLALPLLSVFQRAAALDRLRDDVSRNSVTGPLNVPHIHSANGTAINQGVPAAQASGPLSVALLQDSNNSFYEPFVRPSAGC